MVSEGKQQAIEHLSKADLAFIAILFDMQGGLADGHDKTRNSYTLKFENLKVVRGNAQDVKSDASFEYRQTPKGLKFKTENESEAQIKQAAEDDEVKEPKEGKTYVAILKDAENIDILVEIEPHDISEIINSARDKETATV